MEDKMKEPKYYWERGCDTCLFSWKKFKHCKKQVRELCDDYKRDSLENLIINRKLKIQFK